MNSYLIAGVLEKLDCNRMNVFEEEDLDFG